jgi:hypothetical protein
VLTPSLSHVCHITRKSEEEKRLFHKETTARSYKTMVADNERSGLLSNGFEV